MISWIDENIGTIIITLLLILQILPGEMKHPIVPAPNSLGNLDNIRGITESKDISVPETGLGPRGQPVTV